MKQYISNSDKETRKIAAQLAKELKCSVIALNGTLGAGKTTFVQGFAKGLAIKDKIISPTFVLIRQHKLPQTIKTLFHIDLYRLEKVIDIKELGLEEIWLNPSNITIIEWAQKIRKYLPKDIIKITISKKSTNKRIISVD